MFPVMFELQTTSLDDNRNNNLNYIAKTPDYENFVWSAKHMFRHPIIITHQNIRVGSVHYKSSRKAGREDLPDRVRARTPINIFTKILLFRR